MLRHGRKAAFRRFVFPKCLLSPRGTRAAGHSVSTHTMLRAALKLPIAVRIDILILRLDTHNAACGIETLEVTCNATHIFEVSTHTMLRAALKPRIPAHVLIDFQVPTHTMLRAALKQ